jgi:hypothetical protein
MKSSRARDQFEKWSLRWKDERKQNNPDEIIKLWQDPLPRGWAREIWRGKVGYPRSSTTRTGILERGEHFDVGARFVQGSKALLPHDLYLIK